jgi:post-segregation antitoxin (ccd killing protein)
MPNCVHGASPLSQQSQEAANNFDADSLTKAKNIARARGVNLSTVISEALSEGLRLHDATERSEEVLNAFRRAFSGFTEVERALLDGIVLERAPRR